ncbi:MAG: efflux RND transporter permease subunit [Kiritimatiellae bacterium]|nr:efflux RND transporter permease subunit [Kiritimatiellia bacterium]MDW8458554.1 efflux RND transporter permease subunit [Verrucomicrobiota bacterium]
MKISEVSIKRPIFASMMSLAIVLFGLVSLQRMSVRELPDIDPPIVNVLTVYPGANARVVETEVTEKLEEAINSIEGIKTLTSESREQVSSITVEFDLGRDIDVAAQDVRDRVARVRGELPEDIIEPVVAKQDSDAFPVMWVSLYSDHYSTLELTQIAETQIKDRLQTIPGVSSVIIGGRKKMAMRLRLDPDRLAAHGVTIADVERRLQADNVELPSGRIEDREREYSIITFGGLNTPKEFEDLVIRSDSGALIRLGDLGRAEIAAEDERSLARFQGKPAVGIGIVRQSKANVIEVVKRVKAEIERIRPSLPVDVQLDFPYDEAIFVERAIREVWTTLFIAFGLVLVTIFIFLRNIRSTLIPALTIPVSIAGTFIIMYALGFSINILTMLALVLAIGIVVDDSIIVLENIYRHIEEGMPPMEAAIRGMREIGMAVIATTVSLIAVFIPLAFQTTFVGRLFVEFALAVCGSVAISSFVALTLTAALTPRILRYRAAQEHGRIYNFFERAFHRLQVRYQRALESSLRRRKTVIAVAAAVFAATAWLYTRLDSEFLPPEDKGRLIAIGVAPEGSTVEYTDRMLRTMESIAGETPEIDMYFAAVALGRSGPGRPNETFMFIRLTEGERKHVSDLLDGPRGLMSRMISETRGAFAIPIVPKAVTRGFGQPFQLVLQDTDLDRLASRTQRLLEAFRAEGFLFQARSNFEFNKPEFRLDIDRDRAAEAGIAVTDIARALQILLGGLDLSRFKEGGKEYQVIAQIDRQERLSPEILQRIYLRDGRGHLVQLSNYVTLKEGGGPNAIYHYNRFRSATIEGTPAGITLGEAMARAERILAELEPDARFAWAGESSDLRESGRGFYFIAALALIVVYMSLASQFESLLHPFTIMLTIPLAFFGAFGLLWTLDGLSVMGRAFYGWANYAPDPPKIAHILSAVFPRISGMNMNLISQIGLVLLIGMATKTSILLVEFANQRVAQGLSPIEAMREAGKLRFRPILMTSFSTILGILPIAFGWGAGGESRRPMGIVALGGLLTSTILTLVVIPVVYTVFAEWVARFRSPRRNGLTAAALIAAFALGVAFPAVAQTPADASKQPRGAFDLARCLDTAVAQNYEILSARERLRQQSGSVIEAEGRRIPNIRISGMYQEEAEDLGMPGKKNDATWNLGLEAVQSLYAGGSLAASSQARKLEEEAARLELQSVINNVLLEVRERFYAVLLARSQVRVQEQNVELLQEELQSAKNKLEAGAVSPFNVLRAEVALANGYPPLIRARNDYRLALEELARVLGFPPPAAGQEATLDVVGELSFDSFQTSLAEARALAFANRPELKRLALLREARARDLRAAKGSYQPQLNAFAGYQYQSDPMSEDRWENVDGWRAGLMLNWNLFDGQQTRGRILQAASALEQTRLAEEKARLDIDVEVRRAYSSFVEAQELVTATRKVVEQAEESLRLARSRFDVGAATQLDVLQSQQALTQARDNEVQALFSYNVALARLKKAAGIISQASEPAPAADPVE